MDTNSSVSRSIFHLVPVPWDWRLTVQLILAIVGIIGNSAVIHVYLHTRKLTNSATNRFIAALAVADLVTSICLIPIPTLSYVPDNFAGRFYCKLVYSSFIMWVSIVVSVLTLPVLAVERYVAISQPLRYKQLFSVQMTKYIIVGIWSFAFIFNTFQLYVVDLDSITGACYVDFGSTEFQMFIGISVFIVEYLVPVILMLGSNVRSIQLLKIREKAFENSCQKNSNTFVQEFRQRVIYMLTAVIACFIICWSPDQVAFLAFNLGLVPVQYLAGYLYRAFVALAFLNSCINPVLYAMTNKKFRQAIKQYLFRCSIKRGESVIDPFETGDLISTNDTKLSTISQSGNDHGQVIANNI